jgi:hypothetical protein
MTASVLVQERQSTALALALKFIDPLGGVIAGLFVLQYAVTAVTSMLHGGHGYGSATMLWLWGLVLIFANVLTAVCLLLRGFGISVPNVTTSSLRFGFGVALIAASYFPQVTDWVENTAPSFDFTSTFAICAATAFALGTGAVGGLQAIFDFLTASAAAVRVASRNNARQRSLTGELVLCGGTARGVFHDRNVVTGAPLSGEVLLYGEQSARRGTIAIGAPGSSKTRSKIYPDLYWALGSSPRAGALVFVTKRRATQDCLAIAQAFREQNQIHVVGIRAEREHIDITAGMTHESIGDAIQDGLGTSHSDFWRHGPSAFVEGFIEIAQMLAPATIHVSADVDKEGNVTPGGEAYEFQISAGLPTILKLISLDARRLDAVFAYGFKRAAEIEKSDPRRARALSELLHEVKERVLPLMIRDAKLGEELRQSVLPQLQPFARGPLREAFCDPNGIDLGLLEKGHVILVEVDEAEHPRAVATVVRMVFRRIVQIARDRTASERVGYLDPVILLCDEYTNYAAAGHVQAWNIVRESNFCATVGITSVSALTKQLSGDRDAANAIVANFANKFFFEVDDKATRDLARELIGQSIVLRRGTSEGTSRAHGGSSGVQGGGSHHSQGTSQTESLTEHLEDVLNGSVWRALGAGRDHATAIAFVRAPEGVKTDVVVLGVLDPATETYTALPS